MNKNLPVKCNIQWKKKQIEINIWNELQSDEIHYEIILMNVCVFFYKSRLSFHSTKSFMEMFHLENNFILWNSFKWKYLILVFVRTNEMRDVMPEKKKKIRNDEYIFRWFNNFTLNLIRSTLCYCCCYCRWVPMFFFFQSKNDIKQTNEELFLSFSTANIL